jgi:hypothetical protein
MVCWEVLAAGLLMDGTGASVDWGDSPEGSAANRNNSMKKLATLDFLHSFLPGRSARTLLLLHGTGGNETDLIPLGQSLDPEASLLSPRGKVIENGRPRFFRLLAEGIFDEEDPRIAPKFRLWRNCRCAKLPLDMPPVDFAIVTGLLEEFEVLRELLPELEEDPDSENAQVWYRGRIPAKTGSTYEIAAAF